MIATCLTDYYHARVEQSSPLTMVVILSMAFPIFAAPFARAVYHRRVTRLMNFLQVRSPPAAWWARRKQHIARLTPAANVVKAATPDAFAHMMRDRSKRIRRATFAAYATFVVGAGLSAPLHSGVALEIAITAAVLGIGPALINAIPGATQRWLTVLVAAFLAISMSFDSLKLDSLKNVGNLALLFGFVFGFYLVGTNRTLRALYVPLFFIGFCGLAAAFASDVLAHGSERCLALTTNGISGSGLGLGFLAFGIWIGNRLIAGLARLYERGWISDISLVFLFGIALTAVLDGFWPDSREDTMAPSTATAMAAACLIWVALTREPVACWRMQPAGAARVFTQPQRPFARPSADKLALCWTSIADRRPGLGAAQHQPV
jgi:hypothetical protein